MDINYIKAGNLKLSLLLPYLIGSVPLAFIGGYTVIGMGIGGVGVLLGLIWLFSRFKWGRKYWWILLFKFIAYPDHLRPITVFFRLA